MKFVLNKCFGGFSLSDEAAKDLNSSCYGLSDYDERSNSALIALIEEKGSGYVSGDCAQLAIVDIPDNCTDYEIDEYDGYESITYVVDGKLDHA